MPFVENIIYIKKRCHLIKVTSKTKYKMKKEIL